MSLQLTNYKLLQKSKKQRDMNVYVMTDWRNEDTDVKIIGVYGNYEAARKAFKNYFIERFSDQYSLQDSFFRYLNPLYAMVKHDMSDIAKYFEDNGYDFENLKSLDEIDFSVFYNILDFTMIEPFEVRN
jgi:hypothetical protein